MNMLNRYFGNDTYREYAVHAMKYLTAAAADIALIRGNDRESRR